VTSQEFERTYARFFPPIRAKCRRLLSSAQAADDVAQDVFVRLWQWRERPNLDAPDAARTLLAWLYRTSTRLAIDTLRAHGSRPADGQKLESVPCGVDLDAAIGAKSSILALVEAADDDELQAAVLARVDGLSQPEVALVLGVSERTVRRLLQRFDEQTGSVRKEFAT
jgi:RNA polymerase sigma-70 factor (ECF subfamily)